MRLISLSSFSRYLQHHSHTSNLPRRPFHGSHTLETLSMDMDTNNPLNNRFTHRARVLRHTCRIQVTLINEIWVDIELPVPLARISLSLGMCPRLHPLNQPDRSIPKDKHNSRLPGVSWPKHRSNVNMTSNFRLFETKALRWIRHVEEMIEVAALTSVVFSRNPILHEVEFSASPCRIWPHQYSKWWRSHPPASPPPISGDVARKRRDTATPHHQTQPPVIP
jgi:hypothetical protein